MGIALFITMFVMWPTFQSVYSDSIKPMMDGKIGVERRITRPKNPSGSSCTTR
jgi:flagellar biosynthetic protein FliP